MSCIAPRLVPRSGPVRVRSRHRLRLILVLTAAVLATASWPAPSEAKSQRLIHYSFEQVWPAVIRFLRVDTGCEIAEKDPDAGYVLFVFPDEGKRFRGSLEIVRVRANERDSLRILIRLEDRPAYMEEGLLDRFERKLRAELGPPPRSRPTPAPAPAPKPPAAKETSDTLRP